MQAVASPFGALVVDDEVEAVATAAAASFAALLLAFVSRGIQLAMARHGGHS
jgi:hypothetical protein